MQCMYCDTIWQGILFFGNYYYTNENLIGEISKYSM
jgi:hypothetical protein